MIAAQLGEIETQFLYIAIQLATYARERIQAGSQLGIVRQARARDIQHVRAAVEFRQQQQCIARNCIESVRQFAQRGNILGLQHLEQVRLLLRSQSRARDERAEHRHVADIEMNPAYARRLQRTQHQHLDLDVAFQAGMAVNLRTDLHRLAGAQQARGLRVQHRARVTQPRDALAIEQMRIDARHLRRNVCAQAQHPAGQLVHQLEGLQVEVVSGPGQQGLEVLQHGRYDQLVAVGKEQVEDATAQALDSRRLAGQEIFDVFR